MEKGEYTRWYDQEHGPIKPPVRRSIRQFGGIFFIASLFFLSRFYFALDTTNTPREDLGKIVVQDFRWEDVQPSPSLVFHSCFEKFECARLDVPLDWQASAEEQAKRRAAIAVIRLPATVPVTSAHYGGAVLTNPGGPGGSGVNFLLRGGEMLRTILDLGHYPASNSTSSQGESSGLHYDIISFDPRGVNNTTPSPNCFPDDASRQFWSLAAQAQGMLGANDTFYPVWGRVKGLATGCSEKMGKDWDGIGAFMNTPQVATDMVAIIEAMGKWREDEARKFLNTLKCHKEDAKEILQRTEWRKGEEKLQYWGFSYGTILGATFSDLYPEKVGRVALDGVSDADDYYAGTWLANLQDTDLIIENFFLQCFEAGPLRCPLWSAAGITGIRSTYNAVLKTIAEMPLAVLAAGQYGPDLITRTDAMFIVRNALYKPHGGFVTLARMFASLANGNGTELAALKQSKRVTYCKSPTCSDDPSSESCYAHSTSSDDMPDISAAILCTDGIGQQNNWTSEDHFSKWQALKGQSASLGDYWAEITMYCAHWRQQPAWNYTFPRVESIAEESGTLFASNKTTANPLLFLSTTRDPVTPLRNARKMAGYFGGAGLLVQEGDGHCSISAPSLCAAKATSEYFQRGLLPTEGVICESEASPFDDSAKIEFQTLDEKVREVAKAMDGLAKRVRQLNAPLGI